MTDKYFRLRGLGQATCRCSKPIPVKFGEKTLDIEFVVIPDFVDLIAIGLHDLLRLQEAKIDYKTEINDLRYDSYPVSAAKDIATGIDLNASDNELIANHHATFLQNTSHPNPEFAEAIWAVFLQYKKCWLRLR